MSKCVKVFPCLQVSLLHIYEQPIMTVMRELLQYIQRQLAYLADAIT